MRVIEKSSELAVKQPKHDLKLSRRSGESGI
jgi:hypothetical protein